jgi:hypothetical protein
LTLLAQEFENAKAVEVLLKWSLPPNQEKGTTPDISQLVTLLIS